MSSAEVDRPTKLNQANKKENEKGRKGPYKKHKYEEGRHFKFGRKRLQTFPGNGKFFPPHKRRKKEGFVPPTKFLLGGNICDPLNLNSMQDEEVNRAMNAVTPKSSPLPTPKHRKGKIEVIIPPNICDPLNLTSCNDNEEYEKQLISPTKKASKRRKKRKRASSGSTKDESNASSEKSETQMPVGSLDTAEGEVPAASGPEKVVVPIGSPLPDQLKEKMESPQKDKNKLRLKGLEEVKDKRLRKIDDKDKIVSPVIPQPGAWKSRLPHRTNHDKKKKKKKKNQQPEPPTFKPQNAKFEYGNYNRYYGYRNPEGSALDHRLTVFAQRKELFFDKDVLDIGCNIGHITLAVGRDFAVKSITGIDIDKKLINIARINIKHYVNWEQSPARNDDPGPSTRHGECDIGFFPISMPITYGPIDVPGFSKHNKHKGFPYNVTFVPGNYVLEDDSLLQSEQPQFDTILCLSTTKWIHLNFGDQGLKQAFKRMHAQLRPNGVLILESQCFSRYKKRKALTERIFKNYHSIEFFPQHFTKYLLSPEVGFCKCEVLSMPSHPSKGFQRPIQLYTKAADVQSSSHEQADSVVRHSHEAEHQKELERHKYEQTLFPETSIMSEHSGKSVMHYNQLENVYAPSVTPSYDIPSRINDLEGEVIENQSKSEETSEAMMDVEEQHQEDVTKVSEVEQTFLPPNEKCDSADNKT